MKYFLFLLVPIFVTTPSFAADIKTLLKTITSWDGEPISYPNGKEEATSVQITLTPDEALDFHCHPVPTLAYMLEGEIEVELLSGKTKRFKKGEAFAEVSNRWHKGRNVSDKNPASILVFYIGTLNEPNTIMYRENTAHQCSE